MDGKRYATGLLGGLLVGFLVIVAGSQGAFFANLSAGTATPAGQLNHLSASSSTLFTSTATASTTTAANPTKATNASSTTSTVNQGDFQAAQTTASTLSATSPSPNSGVTIGTGTLSNAVPSSSLYSIVHQPVFADIIVLVPLALAFILGAMIYRLSGSKDKE